MKFIKKVSSVPLTQTEGHIIDSFNTSDDHTTNAPSLNAVETNFISKSEIQIIGGTVVKSVTSGADAVALFTLDALKTAFNTTTATHHNFIACVTNGDGSALSKHMENCTWLNNTLYALWDGTVSGSQSVRINYVIFYIPTN